MANAQKRYLGLSSLIMQKKREMFQFKNDRSPAHTQKHAHTLPTPLAPVWLLRCMYVLIIDSFYRKPSCFIKQVYLIVYLIQIFNFVLTLLCSWLVYCSCPKIQPEWRPINLTHPNNLQHLICVPMLCGREKSAEIQQASCYNLVPGSMQTMRIISRTG